MPSGDSPTRRLSATHAAQHIRAALKDRLGLNRRAVSVRTVRYGLETVLDLSILVPGISVCKVGRVAKPYERVFRDRRTNDVLKGGNRFVEIKLGDNVLTPFVRPILARLYELPPGPPDTFRTVRFCRYRFEIARTLDPLGEECFRLNGPQPYHYNPQQIAKHIARILAQSRQWRRLLTLATSKESHS